ncbi:hypothetical protein D3C86_1288820 [compost metagenome]
MDAPLQQAQRPASAKLSLLEAGFRRRLARRHCSLIGVQRLALLRVQAVNGKMALGHRSPLARLHRPLVGAGSLNPRQQGDQQHRHQDQGAWPRRPEGEQDKAGQAIDVENVARKQQDRDIADPQHQQGHAASEIDVRRLDRALAAVAAQGDQQHPRAEQQGEQPPHRALQKDVLHQPGHPVGVAQTGRRLRHIGFPDAAHGDDVDQQDAAQGKTPQQVQAIHALGRRDAPACGDIEHDSSR